MDRLFQPYDTTIAKPYPCLDDVVKNDIPEGWHLEQTLMHNDYEPFWVGIAFVMYDEKLPADERQYRGYQIAKFFLGGNP